MWVTGRKGELSGRNPSKQQSWRSVPAGHPSSSSFTGNRASVRPGSIEVLGTDSSQQLHSSSHPILPHHLPLRSTWISQTQDSDLHPYLQFYRVQRKWSFGFGLMQFSKLMNRWCFTCCLQPLCISCDPSLNTIDELGWSCSHIHLERNYVGRWRDIMQKILEPEPVKKHLCTVRTVCVTQRSCHNFWSSVKSLDPWLELRPLVIDPRKTLERGLLHSACSSSGSWIAPPVFRNCHTELSLQPLCTLTHCGWLGLYKNLAPSSLGLRLK